MRSGKREKNPGTGMAKAVALFYFTAFLLLGLRDMQWQGFALAVGVPMVIFIGTQVMDKVLHVDSLYLSLTNFLCALGILVLYDTKPALAYHQLIYYGLGIVFMVLCIYVIRFFQTFRYVIWLITLGALGFLVLPLVMGREVYGARNWVFVGSYSFQPSEFVKIALLIILSYFMSRRRMLPWLVIAVACLGLLMLQKDLGTALLYYGVTLMLYYAATANLPVTALGLMGGAGAAVMGYRMFAHVKRRVAIWRNPFADYDNAGYQIVQGLMALASGNLFGVGLGLGSPTTIPVYETDFIFAVICEQFGLIFGLCVLMVYTAMVWRGITIAMAARTSFHGLLALGASLMLGLQTFVIIGGVVKLIPLTGVTLPFVSSGGSSMLSSLGLTGLIQGVASINEDHYKADVKMTDF